MRVRPVPTAALLGVAGLAALLAVPTGGASAAPPPAVAPVNVNVIATDRSTCVIPPSASGGGSSDAATATAGSFYEGPTASRTYDATWKKAFPIPHLDAYVPQGMTTWENWDGTGQDLLLIGLYRGPKEAGEQSLIAAVDPRDGRQVASVRVRNAHLGGIAVVGDFLFTQDGASKVREKIRRYKIGSLRDAVRESNRTGDMPFLAMLKDKQEVHGADFMTVHDGKLWAGRYKEHLADRMYEYRVDAEGRLTPTGGAWPIPPRTQGALVTDTTFVFNSSNHTQPGVMVVTEKSRSASRRTVCFASPSMGEGMALVGDRAFNLFEGGSYKYPKAVNRITDLHEASMRSLESLVRK